MFARGDYPVASLIQGTDGTFYGTTPGAGANAKGTVFEFAIDSSERLVHSFGGSEVK